MKQQKRMDEVNPRQVAEAALSGIEANKEEVLVDDFTSEVCVLSSRYI